MLAYTRPLLVAGFGGGDETCQALEQVPLKAGKGEKPAYSELKLQTLIQDHPALLPVAEIEPALVPLVPVCLELPVVTGFVDNLLMTEDGGIVLVETKLWRNAEARREVVAQILDYAKDLSGLDYAGLESRVRLARKEPGLSLYRLVCPEGAEEDEARFSDAVSRNLRLGRILLLIVGDGIQENVEQLVGFLQRHVALQFTLGLVALSLWRHPVEGWVLVQPRVLARTVQIERAVVRIEQGVVAHPVQIEPVAASGPSAPRPASISSETFNERLAATNSAGLPGRIGAFLDAVAPLGVVGEQKVNLNLKYLHPEAGSFSLGSIEPSGIIDTSYCNAAAQSFGRLDLVEAYHRALARLIPGGSVKETAKRTGWRIVGADGRSPPVSLLLDAQEGWIAAIQDYAKGIDAAAETAA
jgi:hypothetical protein